MTGKNKQSISAGNDSINIIAGSDFILNLNEKIPTELVDQHIGEEIEKLRKSRFYLEFDKESSSLRLGRQLAKGNLSGGSNNVRGPALAWCARFLSPTEDLNQAEEFLGIAKTLGDFTETKIAEAFILSKKGNKTEALSILAAINSNTSRGASFMIVGNHDGDEGAIRWMNVAGYKVSDIDPDAKNILLNHLLQLGQWNDVALTVEALTEDDFRETPILYHWVGLSILIPTIPQDFRSVVLMQVPLNLREFPLSSDVDAMDARCMAHSHFLNAVRAEKQLACLRAAKIDDEYALWLELRDPEMSTHGKTRLEEKLRDQRTALGFVNFAIQFGIKLDINAVERDIEQSIAINGGMTIDAAIARFVLAFTKPTPQDAANYIASHYNQLVAHIDAKLMRRRQIELLLHAGLIEKAKEVLNQLIVDGISDEQEKNLRRIIAEAQENDPIEQRKMQFETTGVLADLINLVVELEHHQRWNELCEFGMRLFEKTHSLNDAERLVTAFNNAYRSETMVSFLKENNNLLSQSNHLRMSYAWGLYHEGAFLESRAVLTELSDEVDSVNYRALQVSLGIATGDWTSLSAYIASEYQNRHDRSAREMIGSGQLALYLHLPQAKDLVFEAAAKANDDADILTSAYFIATSAGWEDDPKVFEWIQKAAALSGDTGPIYKMSLKDVFDRKPEWDRHESETWRLLSHGQIPIFIAAQSLNRTLINLVTFNALANLDELDPRRRNTIPFYSGKRMPSKFDFMGKVAAFDATALLTLSFLKILDRALDVFETVYITHTTLGWLFEERQKAMFHQPSRIENAHKIRDFLATDILEKFTPSTVASSDLSIQVGEELAVLIAEAEKIRESDNTQQIVVRSAPVHRISSLMEEEADLTVHATVLSSCLAVVAKLRQKGQITSDEEKRARAYLQLQEKPWPKQPVISEGATLYLDDLTVSYFLHLGLLGKLKKAGFTAVVPPRVISETDGLISYERISNDVKEIIEGIRKSLSLRIETGQVRIGRKLNHDELKKNSIPQHPTISIIELANYCDVAFIDDRFFNQHAYIKNDSEQAFLFSTLDLLDFLAEAGGLSYENRLEYRTHLRRAGYFFIPISADELERCLIESSVADGVVVEKAELKAIRESVLLVRMSDVLRLPSELPWLNGIMKTFFQVLKNLWVDGAEIQEVTARSNWLVDQIDIRGWAHSFVSENADNLVRKQHATHILSLLTPPIGVAQSVLDAYWHWVEERILAPIKEQFPEIYDWLVDWYRKQIVKMAKTQFQKGDKS